MASRCMAALVALLTWIGQAFAGSLCPSDGGETVRLVAVDGRLDLSLADGRVARLVGLDPPGPTPEQGDFADSVASDLWTELQAGALRLRFVSDRPDRWGRRPAFAFLGSDNLAAHLIAKGLARYLAEPAAAPCRDVFLAAETMARASKLGLWRDPYYAVLDVDDRAAFKERSGSIVIAEARLIAVEPGTFRTTLRLAAPTLAQRQGSSGGHILVATISPRVMKASPSLAARLHDLVGHRLRLRGLLDLRFGPHLDLEGPDSIEDVPDQASGPVR